MSGCVFGGVQVSDDRVYVSDVCLCPGRWGRAARARRGTGTTTSTSETARHEDRSLGEQMYNDASA